MSTPPAMSTQEWMDDAVCVREDPELFFLPAMNPGRPSPAYLERMEIQIREAKAVCATCPVIDTCLAWALANDEVGIWGGTTDEERAQLTQGGNAA